MYHVVCECGNRCSVSIAAAGTTINCPKCAQTNEVPSISTLKRLAGDANPFLDTLQKIRKSLAERSPPFDGKCHFCPKEQATIERPVTFRFLLQRRITSEEGIQPDLLGFSLVVGASNEQWCGIRFPLLFCKSCHRRFESDWNRARIANLAKSLVTYGMLAVATLVLVIIAILVPFISVPGVLLIIYMANRFRTRKMVDPFIHSRLSQVPHISDAIVAEDEYFLNVYAARPYASVSAR